MADLSGLGDLVLTVGGDISPLEDALNEIPAVASQAAAQIQAAFDALPSATDEVAQGLASLGQAAEAAGAVAVQGIQPIPESLHEIKPAADEADSSLQEFLATALELGGIALTLDALKESILGSLEAFGEFQRVGESLALMTGNAAAAADAMERIPALADQLGISLASAETAMQKLNLIMGEGQLENIPAVITAIADASRAAGTDFDTAAAKFENMANSGRVMGRQLTQLGLNMQDVAAAMGLVGASDKDVTAAFKAISDGADGTSAAAERMAVLVKAAEDKMGGDAAATANDVVGSFTQIKNALHEAAVNIGDSLAMLGSATGMDLLKTAIKGIETFIVSMIGYLQQATDLIMGFYNISTAVMVGIGKAAAAAASGDFAGAEQQIVGMASNIQTSFQHMTESMQSDWANNGKIIDKIWADTTAAVNTNTATLPPKVDLAAAAMQAALEKFATAADTYLQKIPQTYESYVAALADGGQKATAIMSGLQKLIEQAGVDMQSMSGAPLAAMQGWVNTLQNMQGVVKGFVDQDNFNKLAQQVQQLSDKFGPQLAGLSIDTLNWVNAMNAAAQDVPAALNKITDDAVLKNFLESQKQLDASTTTLADHEAKWADAYYKATIQQIAITGTLDNVTGTFAAHVVSAGDQIKNMVGQINAVGVQTAQQMQSALGAIQLAVQAAAAMNLPLTQQLQIQAQLIQGYININTAIGASGTSTLQLTEQLKAVQVQEGILKDQTMGLSNLYTTMLKDFGTAWDNLGKGIGDALVSGQNFGAAMTSVFDSLKKSIAELVTQYLMTMLKNALLENTNLMQDFNKVFNSIFASGGSITTGLSQTSTAFQQNSQVMVSSFGQAANSVQSSANSISSSLQSMVSMLGAVGAIVGAIAGIFSAIELAHTNTLLSRIEESTRRTDIVTENNLVPDTKTIANLSQEMLSWAWGTATSILLQINQDLDTIVGSTNTMAAGITAIIAGGGSGVSSTGNANFQATGLVNQLNATASMQADAAAAQTDAAAAQTNAASAATAAAATLTSASTNLTVAANTATAATTQQLSLTNAATNATTYAAVNLSTAANSMTSAADALSASALKSDTYAGQLVGFAAILAAQAGVASTTVQAAATALVQVANTVSQAGLSTNAYTGPGGNFTFAPTVMPTAALPNVGPSGANSGGLNPAVYTPGYQANVGGTGPTIVNNINAGTVVGANGMADLARMIGNEQTRALQNQGFVLRRG